MGKLGLERPRIDLRQQFALGYVLAFDEGDPVKVSVDPGLDRDDIEGMYGADAAQENRHVLALYQRRPDRDSRHGSLSRRRRFLPTPEVPAAAAGCGEKQCGD